MSTAARTPATDRSPASIEWYVDELRRLAREHTPELAFSHMRGEPVEYVHGLIVMLAGSGEWDLAEWVRLEASRRIVEEHGRTPAVRQSIDLLRARWLEARARWDKHHPKGPAS